MTKPSDDDYLMTFSNPVTKWSRWFAWRPVGTVDKGMVWLIPVWRRRAMVKMMLTPGGGNMFFQYATDSQWGGKS